MNCYNKRTQISKTKYIPLQEPQATVKDDSNLGSNRSSGDMSMFNVLSQTYTGLKNYAVGSYGKINNGKSAEIDAWCDDDFEQKIICQKQAISLPLKQKNKVIQSKTYVQAIAERNGLESQEKKSNKCNVNVVGDIEEQCFWKAKQPFSVSKKKIPFLNKNNSKSMLSTVTVNTVQLKNADKVQRQRAIILQSIEERHSKFTHCPRKKLEGTSNLRKNKTAINNPMYNNCKNKKIFSLLKNAEINFEAQQQERYQKNPSLIEIMELKKQLSQTLTVVNDRSVSNNGSEFANKSGESLYHYESSFLPIKTAKQGQRQITKQKLHYKSQTESLERKENETLSNMRQKLHSCSKSRILKNQKSITLHIVKPTVPIRVTKLRHKHNSLHRFGQGQMQGRTKSKESMKSENSKQYLEKHCNSAEKTHNISTHPKSQDCLLQQSKNSQSNLDAIIQEKQRLRLMTAEQQKTSIERRGRKRVTFNVNPKKNIYIGYKKFFQPSNSKQRKREINVTASGASDLNQTPKFNVLKLNYFKHLSDEELQKHQLQIDNTHYNYDQ